MSGITLILTSLLAVHAGARVAFQQMLNANLRTQIGSPWWAGVVSYAVGLVAILIIALLAPGPRPALVAGGPWIAWTGGVFGAIFITIAILMVPRLGAATTLALIVVGQMLASLAFDHFGLLGITEQPVTLIRLLGVALLILGVVLVRM